MRPATISAVLLVLASSAAPGQQMTGDRVYGPRQIVTIEVTDVADEIQRDEIIRRVPELMNKGEYATRFHTNGELLIARVAPIDNVKAFAAKIDFGKVTDIDERIITVKAKPIPGAGTAAAHPLNRAFEGLKSSSADVRYSALKQFSQIEPDRRRGEVLRALEGQLSGDDLRAKLLAIEALGIWGTKTTVAALVKLLDAPEFSIRRAAIRSLGKLENPAAIEPISRRLGDQYDRSDAVKVLVAFDSAAEKAVLRVLAGKDNAARAAACEVLARIGTQESVKALEAAARDSDTSVRTAAGKALKSLYPR